MIVAVDVDDVADDLLVQGAVRDAEQLGDGQAREGGIAGAQEELARLAVERVNPNGLAASQPSWPRRVAIASR